MDMDDERVDGAILWHMDVFVVGVEDTSLVSNHSSDGRMLESNNNPTCFSIRRDLSVEVGSLVITFVDPISEWSHGYRKIRPREKSQGHPLEIIDGLLKECLRTGSPGAVHRCARWSSIWAHIRASERESRSTEL